MTEPRASSLKSVQWFPAPAPKSERGVGATLAKLAVGGVVGGLFFMAQRATLAYVVWGIAAAVSAISLASPAARKAIDGGLARFGRAVGSVLGAALLTLVYVLVVTPLRFVRRLSGTDELHLRDRGRVSYWLPCDDDARKVRYVGAMFATEVKRPGGHPVRTALIVVAALVLLAEGMLRTQGFGHAVLYHADPVVGYYPAPNQSLGRYGGLVRTNQYGMRSPDIAHEKRPGDFRILMLGDSTQWGGSYVDQADIYSTLVEARLNKLGGPGKVEVMAMGANGWGPFEEHGYVTKFGTFDADVAIINLPLDDVNRPLYGLMDVPFFGDVNPPTFALEEILNNRTWWYRKKHAGLNHTWETEQSPLGIAEYGHLADDLYQHGVGEVYGAILPGKSSGMGGPPNDASMDWLQPLRKTFKEHRVLSFYPRGLFAGKGRTEDIYYDDVHLKRLGHALYADFLLGRIEKSKRLRAWLGRAPDAEQPVAEDPAHEAGGAAP